MPQEVLNIFYGALLTVITGLVGWATERLIVWLNGKIKDRKVAKMSSDIINIVSDAVKQIFQTFVETLKKNDKFDKEAQKEAKDKAMKVIMDQLTPELISYIQDNFGNVQEYLSNKIEAVLFDLKN